MQADKKVCEGCDGTGGPDKKCAGCGGTGLAPFKDEVLDAVNVNDRLDRLRCDIGSMIDMFIDDLKQHFSSMPPSATEKDLREGIAHAIGELTEQVDHYDDDSGNPPHELVFIRGLIAHLNGTLMTSGEPKQAEPKETIDEDQFIWHATIDKYGTPREFTFLCGEGFDDAVAAATQFMSKRFPNRYRDNPRFAGDSEGDKFFRECPHDPELRIVGLKRGHELSSTQECDF